jgi:acyl-CoA synthetase (AMP-forming)/AMP-acid ligase II
MIISGGENVFSKEVEDVLRLYPGVTDAAVIGVPDAQWGEAVKAYVVLSAQVADCEASIIRHCRTQLAGYKCPRSIEFIEEIPRHRVTGKIDRKALRAPHWEDLPRMIN